jgi:TRAP-type C4-dicarboxylate transport system permease small subunit
MRMLEFFAKLFAVAAGVLLVGITMVTCVSLVGRNTVGWAIVGDFELTAAAAGAAIALFLPWCQVERGHIMVDFFTAKASPRTQRFLDRAGNLILAVVLAVVAWRCSLGGLKAWETQAGSMMLGWPEWTSYAAIAPALILSAVIAAHQAIFDTQKPEEVAA